MPKTLPELPWPARHTTAAGLLLAGLTSLALLYAAFAEWAP